jgi:hypothetical protein
MTDLAERLLRDRADHAERERRRRAINRQPKPEGEFDPYDVTRWRTIAGGDASCLPKTPMRMGKTGWWIACRACGAKFESKGMAYCESCLALPAEERRQMKPAARQCQAPGCNNVIAGTARADARYCSDACRQRARYDAIREKNDANLPDIGPPENLTDTHEKSQLNQGPKIDPRKTDPFARLQGDAVLSNWKPSSNAKAEDIPDIPDFLGRAD